MNQDEVFSWKMFLLPLPLPLRHLDNPLHQPDFRWWWLVMQPGWSFQRRIHWNLGCCPHCCGFTVCTACSVSGPGGVDGRQLEATRCPLGKVFLVSTLFCFLSLHKFFIPIWKIIFALSFFHGCHGCFSCSSSPPLNHVSSSPSKAFASSLNSVTARYRCDTDQFLILSFSCSDSVFSPPNACT